MGYRGRKTGDILNIVLVIVVECNVATGAFSSSLDVYTTNGSLAGVPEGLSVPGTYPPTNHPRTGQHVVVHGNRHHASSDTTEYDASVGPEEGQELNADLHTRATPADVDVEETKLQMNPVTDRFRQKVERYETTTSAAARYSTRGYSHTTDDRTEAEYNVVSGNPDSNKNENITKLDLIWDEMNEDELDYDDESLPEEQRLMNMLMRYYERSVRPVQNASETVLVRMGLTVTQILDMDEKNQILVTNVWLDQEWDDMFMTWDPDQYGGLKMLRLPCHKLWLPDIVLYNNAAEYTDGLMPANAMITHTGEIFWPVPTKLQSTCKVDVTYFPFDEQFCRLKFGSWTYDGFQVDMTNRTTEVDLSNYVQNGEWQLVEILIERNVVYYACCPEPFPDVTFIMHIRRRTIYYLYNVIFPCVMMSSLTLLVFCLPPDSGEKITLGITVLLAFSVFLLRLGEDLPETSEFIPLLSIYLTIVMGLTSVSVIMTVMVLNLHHRGPTATPVPGWLRSIFLRRRIRHRLHLNRSTNYVEGYIGDDKSHYVQNVSLRMTIENLAQELKDELDTNNVTNGNDTATLNNLNADHHQQNSHHIITDLPTSPPDHNTVIYHPLSTNNSQGGFSRPHTEDQILTALHTILERHEREDNQEYVVHEWRQVAVGVDRILFWVFFVGTVTSTLVVLVIAPLTRFI